MTNTALTPISDLERISWETVEQQSHTRRKMQLCDTFVDMFRNMGRDEEANRMLAEKERLSDKYRRETAFLRYLRAKDSVEEKEG